MDKSILIDLYLNKKLSGSEVAIKLGKPISTVDYWLKKHSIQNRSISDAIYTRSNPAGDPFKPASIKTKEQLFLYGLGLGLFWGEGNKKDKYSVRLGNSDPDVIRLFIRFLKEIYNINEGKLRFGLQIFNDSSSEVCLDYWSKFLSVPRSAFYKVTVSDIRGIGTYKNKSKYGVVTVYFSNKKLRDTIIGSIEKLRVA